METALKEAGTCGRFQVYHVVFTQLPRFVAVWGIMVMMFGSYDPGWRCKEFSRLSKSSWNKTGRNSSASSIYNIVSHGNDDASVDLSEVFDLESSTQSSYFEFYNRSSPKKGTIIKGNADYNGTCDVMEFCDDVEFNPESITIVSEFKLVCHRKWILQVIMLVMGSGFLTGALLGGQVGEKFGRKVSLYGGCFIMFVFSGVSIFSFHWIMYMLCLFLMGVGGNFIQSTSSIFSMEFLNSKWRSIFSAIPTWNVSLCIFTFATAMIKSWKQVHMVTCALSLIACSGHFLLSESMRWLVVHGKYAEAEKVIHKVARINRKPPPKAETLLRLKEESDNAPDKKPSSSSSSSSSSSASTSSSSTTYTYLHLFQKSELRILTLKFTTIYLMIFLTYFALSFGINSLPGDFYFNAVVSSIVEATIVIITGPLCNKIGRRWGGVAVSILGAISCVGIVVSLFTSDGEIQSTAIKMCAFLARGGSMAKSVVATVFMAELYPTAVRNVAFGMFRAMAGVGALFGPFLIPSATRDSFAICFSIMACCFGMSLMIFMSLSETNKLCLMDTIDEPSMKRAAEDECA